MMPVRRWYQWRPNRFLTLYMMFSIADNWARYISKHTKARKQVLKSNLRIESHVYNQKKAFLSNFFLFCKETNCEKVSRDNQDGFQQENDGQCYSFYPWRNWIWRVCKRLIICASASWFVHNFFVLSNCFFFFLMCPGLEVSLGVEKTEVI